MQSPSHRIFSLDEANALLPQIRYMLEGIREKRIQILELQSELERRRFRGVDLHNKKQEMNFLLEELAEDIKDLHSLGCFLKDIERGLVDFLAIRDGEEVFLCWQMREATIRFWHGTEEGFRGRRPLDEE